MELVHSEILFAVEEFDGDLRSQKSGCLFRLHISPLELDAWSMTLWIDRANNIESRHICVNQHWHAYVVV